MIYPKHYLPEHSFGQNYYCQSYTSYRNYIFQNKDLAEIALCRMCTW